jgi:DNA-binding transcriptional LysR family regulator
LVAAADCGSLSKAARQLGARLSTTSRQIAELEAEIGEPLLVRTGRGVRPTPIGEPFIERARFILRELDSAVAQARGEREQSVSHLRISAPIELSLSLLPACIAAFHARHPAVQLDLHADSRRVSLLEEDFDAAIRLGRLASSELIARPLGTVQLVVCAAPRTGAARSASTSTPTSTFSDLATRHFIGVLGTREQLSGQVRGTPLSLHLQPRIRVSTFTEAAELATRTDLVAVLPDYVARRFLHAGTLTALAADLTLPTIDVHMLFARRHRETAALKDLAASIAERLQPQDLP